LGKENASPQLMCPELLKFHVLYWKNKTFLGT
jgi:hypothetical protein